MLFILCIPDHELDLKIKDAHSSYVCDGLYLYLLIDGHKTDGLIESPVLDLIMWN